MRNDLHGVGPHIAALRAETGDDRPDCFPWECMTDENDPALMSGDAVTAVRHRPDDQVNVVSNAPLSQDSTPQSLCARHQRLSARRVEPRPDRNSPVGRGQLCDERSWYGTDTTTTPGVNRSRVFRRSALWLCSSVSHQ